DAALRAAQVVERLVLLPRELLGDRSAGAEAEARHRLEEALQSFRIVVEDLEEIAALLGLVLRRAGLEALGERAPEAVEPRVAHLEEAAEIGRLAAVQEELGLGGIAVLGALAVEHPQRDQGVQEVADAPRVKVHVDPEGV